MTALCIIGGIFLLFFGIAMIRAEVIIKYADDFGLAVRVCGIKITIMPRKQKKIRPRDYSPKKLAKRAAKEKKKAEKAAAKKKEKDAKKAADKAAKADAKKAGRNDISHSRARQDGCWQICAASACPCGTIAYKCGDRRRGKHRDTLRRDSTVRGIYRRSARQHKNT